MMTSARTRDDFLTRENCFTDPAIHSAHHTSLNSVTICPVKIQMCSARHAEDKKGSDKLSWEQTLSLDTTDACIVHQQPNKDCATTKTDLTEGRKTTKTPRRVSKTWSIDKLDYTSRFVRVIPTLSQHCRKTVTSSHRLKTTLVR